MNNVKKSAMLMTKGIMELRQNPPGLACTIRRFRHPDTRKEVTLYPVPNIASPHYFRRILDGDTLMRDFDKVLCEDGRLPFQAGTALARKHEVLKRMFPFFAFRPVAADGAKFDGIVQRDAVESRMAYQMLLDGADPPIDPRGRRAVERIDSYADGTRTVCPWGVYHIVYMTYKLRELGYEVEYEDVVEVVGVKEVMFIGCFVGILTFWAMVALYRLVFGF
uniref:Uncharacterized protein n=1 Tax=Trypanosoma congolense (strain IL3000) TaxID=1068625 RepID=G0URJ7_TRYCI|nr:conserved hypothetical protein [Trypanosoma congolense IL3000]